MSQIDGSTLDVVLVTTRSVHFAAVALAAGSLLFQTFVAAPVLQATDPVALRFRKLIIWIVAVALAFAVVTGAAWLLIEAGSMSGLPIGEALAPSVIGTVVSETQFGRTAIVRLALAIILASCLRLERFAAARWGGLAAALGLVVSLAWVGHSGSADGPERYLDIGVDALHLLAAAAWLGGLLPLVIILNAFHDSPTPTASRATRRFSVVGIISVMTLAASGLFNSVRLVGSLEVVTTTEYGRVLLTKTALFSIMLMFAAFNRLVLTPRLSRAMLNERSAATRYLICNTSIEFVLGCAVLAAVGMLGTLHPAAHFIGLTAP